MGISGQTWGIGIDVVLMLLAVSVDCILSFLIKPLVLANLYLLKCVLRWPSSWRHYVDVARQHPSPPNAASIDIWRPSPSARLGQPLGWCTFPPKINVSFVLITQFDDIPNWPRRSAPWVGTCSSESTSTPPRHAPCRLL